MFGKSREEIDQRRTLKRRFVNVTMEIAAAGPEALLGNRTLNESQTGVVTVLGREFYLGLTELGEHRSYRDVKHYKRRKRWLS